MALSPEKTYENGLNYIRSQQEAQAQARQQENKYNRDVAMEQVKQQNRIQLKDRESDNRIREIRVKEQNKGTDNKEIQAADAKAAALKAMGYSDEQIAEYYPRMLGLVQMGKQPQQQLSDTVKLLDDLNKDSYEWQDLTQDEKIKAAKDFLKETQKYGQEQRGTGRNQGGSGVNQGRGLPMYP